ncbi:M56 family metallopeptidase [Propionibacteriaceae bacterium Y2011]|uniref:M56 family metallopeptidase n=1 Tax=Microlunatus sp. Y2014 TaxID=3418488 RepID=UPI003B45DB79
MITALVLVVISLVLVGPGPYLVKRWRWLHQVPRAAIVLWQAGAVAALVAVIGAGVSVLRHLPDVVHPVRLAVSAVVLIFVGHVVVRLLWFGIRELARSGSRRRRHRDLVDLLARSEEGRTGSRHYVVSGAEPVAYCLPGFFSSSRVVVSSGALDTLAEDEFDAVLAHEQSHLRARHDIVLDTFAALHRAFPVGVRSELPLQQARVLVEMMADDNAVRQVGSLPLVRAMAALSPGPAPEAALGLGGALAPRLDRLTSRSANRRLLALLTYAMALSLLAVPVAVLLVG